MFLARSSQADCCVHPAVLGRGYNHSVDWWTLGVLMYVLLTARQPFSSPKTHDPMEVRRPPAQLVRSYLWNTAKHQRHDLLLRHPLLEAGCQADFSRKQRQTVNCGLPRGIVCTCCHSQPNIAGVSHVPIALLAATATAWLRSCAADTICR